MRKLKSPEQDFDVGRAIRSDELTREERVALFGEPIAALLARPVQPRGPALVVTSIDRAAGTVTFDVAPPAPSSAESALIGAMAAASLSQVAISRWWIPRSAYECLRVEHPHMPEVVGEGSIIRVDSEGAHGEE